MQPCRFGYSVRVFASQRGPECGPIAVYNLARLLQAQSARGGYRANRARLLRAAHWTLKNGAFRRNLWRAARRELRGSQYKLIRRRPIWRNLIVQLHRARIPAVGLAIWSTRGNHSHAAAVWRPHGRGAILAANAAVTYAVAPLYVLEDGAYWSTSVHPEVYSDYGKLIEFWQAVRV